MVDETTPEGEEVPAGANEPTGGVFGNLPRSRPGTRSPRRRRTAPGAGDAPDPATAQEARDAPGPPPRSGEPRDQAEELGEEEEQQGGIEDLAWAGVAAAAEAATLGVRLANRALGAVRDSIDRR